jgi:hypothetical protein
MRTKIKEPEIYHDTMSQAIDTCLSSCVVLNFVPIIFIID